MKSKLYSVMFDCHDYYATAKEQVVMAKVATKALYGEAAVRLEAFTWRDDDLLRIQVDASSEVGRVMLRILVTQLDHLVGVEGFSVCQASYEDVSRIDRWKESGVAC